MYDIHWNQSLAIKNECGKEQKARLKKREFSVPVRMKEKRKIMMNLRQLWAKTNKGKIEWISD